MIHDVVIAGGGPVGLLLACELRFAEIYVVVLEQNMKLLRPCRGALVNQSQRHFSKA